MAEITVAAPVTYPASPDPLFAGPPGLLVGHDRAVLGALQASRLKTRGLGRVPRARHHVYVHVELGALNGERPAAALASV
jgi:hypothetical protein